MTPTTMITTRTQKVWLRDDGILAFQSLPGAEESRDDAVANVKAGFAVGGGKKYPALIDLRGVKKVDRGARAYYSSPETAQVELAAALLIGSAVGRIIGNFFLGLNKPMVPVRLFTSEDEAIAWLKGFLP